MSDEFRRNQQDLFQAVEKESSDSADSQFASKELEYEWYEKLGRLVELLIKNDK